MLKQFWEFLSKAVNNMSWYSNYWLGFKNAQLFEAAKTGNTAKVLDLLAKGTFIDCKDKWGNTPLHYAAFYGCTETIEELISHNANVNKKNVQLDTPLHFCGAAGNSKIAQILLKNGAILSAINKHQETPIHAAVKMAKLDTVALFIETGARMDSAKYNSLLETAVAAEKIESIDWLLNHHPSRNNINAFELFQVSIKEQKLEALRYLMRCFVLTKSQLNELVDLALQNGDLRSVQLLISVGADINTVKTSITSVVKKGQIELFAGMVALGANITVRDNQGNNILHLAAHAVNYGMLKTILSYNVLNPKETNYEGVSALDLIKDRINKLRLQLKHHRLDHQLRLENHINQQKMIEQMKEQSDSNPNFKRMRHTLNINNEVLVMNQVAMRKENVLISNIEKLVKIQALLSEAETHFNLVNIPNTSIHMIHQLPKPSAPPMEEWDNSTMAHGPKFSTHVTLKNR